MLAIFTVAAAAAEAPCDITGAAGNPCVAAHSTVRALYSKYNGGLYIVQKNQTQEQLTIGTLKPGGFADKAKHDTFCGPRKDCVILSGTLAPMPRTRAAALTMATLKTAARQRT